MLQIYHTLDIHACQFAFLTVLFVIFVIFCSCFLCLCLCVYLCVCVLPPACLRSFLSCILCCDCLDPLDPPNLDPRHPSYPSAARPSLTPLQGAAERPQTTLPHPSLSPAPPGQWTVVVRGPQGVDTMGGRGSIAGLSCSTLTPSEGMDTWWLLRTPRRQRFTLGNFCPRLVARFRRMNFNS